MAVISWRGFIRARTLMSKLLLLTSTLCTVIQLSSAASTYVVSSYTDPTNIGDIDHLVTDDTTGKVYIGAVNRLYQLDERLEVEKTATTGPQMDSPNCPPSGDCDSESSPKEMTNSHNKALVVDYDNNELIACSNLFQGCCEKRSLQDITDREDSICDEAVVPNDIVSSAYLFIGPGPQDASRLDINVLYVGATRSSQGIEVYRDLVPAVCSRKLDSFDYVLSGLVSNTKITIDIQQREQFLVDYVYGFSSNGFSYFLTVQKDSVDSTNYVTRIVRMCQNDENFSTYTEVPLECKGYNAEGNESATYNILVAAYMTQPGETLARNLGIPHLPPLTDSDVLFTVFARSEPDSKVPLPGTVMCIYTLTEIRSRFTETIQECFKGVGNTGPAHIVVPKTCSQTELDIVDDYCGAYPINNPIAGTDPLLHESIVNFPDSVATSMIVTKTHKYTVVFIGTQDGILKKVVVESGNEAKEYKSFEVQGADDNPINPDMAFDRSRSTLYVTTSRKVMRVRVENCTQYTSCLECLEAQDPYCGWCSLENRCTLRKDCTDSQDALRWLPYKDSQCTKILHVQPKQVQKQKESTELVLQVQYLPRPINSEYTCSFTGSGVTRHTPANVVGNPQGQISVNNTIRCHTPPTNLLPSIPTGKDHLVMVLAVSMGDQNLVSTNFTFFDCERHTSCSSCTSSDFPCTWCVKAHKCLENRETCGTDVMITGKNVPGPTDNPGPDSCPRIEAGFTEILVAAGVTTQITIKAVELLDFQQNFQCVFEMDGREVKVDAETRGTVIECDPRKFTYSADTKYHNVPFEIMWSSPPSLNVQRALDNPSNIQVKVYKCTAMANSCGDCLTQDDKYHCGWCKPDSGAPSCTHSRDCQGPDRKWLDNSETCPNPVITSFHPMTGPTEGGTMITIEGENLGKIFDDIKAGVIVANKKCETDSFANLYIPAKRIVCKTSKSNGRANGSVEVNVGNKHVARSQEKFFYVIPRIEGFHPIRGPQSGGTRLTLSGRYLNTGTNINITVANRPCQIDRSQLHEKQVVCITPRSLIETSGPVRMAFDSADTTFAREYHFVTDPNITKVEPAHSILNGGNKIHVFGSNLDVVQNPRMVLFFSFIEYISDCTGNSSTEMTCESPSLESSGLQSETLVSNGPMDLSYGFILDGVVEMKNLTKHSKEQKMFRVYPNPEIEEFEGAVKTIENKNKEQYLTIKGRFLDAALTKNDYQVKVGKADCVISEVSSDKIFCTPPDSSEEGVGESAEVIVKAGSNLTFVVGQLKYEGTDIFPSMLVIIAAIVVAVILLAIIFFVVVAYRRKSRENDRVVKRMTNQMDVLEARVAKECKEAFAELQTDMTELTSDLYGESGIPFRDYRSFTMRVLFPGDEDHPVTRPLEVLASLKRHVDTGDRSRLEHGLNLLNNLIGNKVFLLLFIRTLEADKGFTVRYKVKVASLLSVALQDRMEYHTDILKTLLAELIEKSVEGRNHPKLLLRRTESVAEKMLTNWFTFMLYSFLKECAGEPLYMLFKAIKQQVDKGPVDALTSEARYSLSEDKLIRQQIDYKGMTIHVLDVENNRHVDYPVKVLDCDTISQVKEKILDTMYKTRAYSRRPAQSTMDLEWHTGIKGRVVLQDIDQTTKSEGDYKRLNTLAHYKVPEGSVMSLIPVQNSMYNLSLGSDRSGSQARFDIFNGSPTLSRSVSPHKLSLADIESGSRCYHLVKQHDTDIQREGDRGSKMVSEVYLTRLLATKGPLQQFVDDLFETIFSTTNRTSSLPIAIKYMFDFLDDQALLHGISSDQEVVHTWKSNSLPLRFWINIMKNPDFVFDINKSNIVDSCLSVVAQTFMDSCSMSEIKLSKESPSSKLLYAKDIPKYKSWVERYYQDIKQIPAISDQDMNTKLAEESRAHKDVFTLKAALFELYEFVKKYDDELMTNLEEDEFARNNRLPYRLEQVHHAMDSEC